MITYAIGDVHGRADLLHALLAAIRRDAAQIGRPYRVIFLGDVIDRGSNSKLSLDLVIRTLREVPHSRFILGNHEEFMLQYLEVPEERDATRDVWLANGGLETLHSYGLRGDEEDTVVIRRLRQHRDHIALLHAGEDFVEDERRFYAHAGTRPGIPLHQQSARDLRWIREEFLDSTVDFGKTVIHGHTPTSSRQPEIHSNRIGIDTMAFASDRLTAARLLPESDTVSFLCTARNAGEIVVGETAGLRIGQE